MIIEKPSKHALIDINAFDLVHMQFYRMALDEPAGIDHATIRDHDLGHPTNKPSAKCKKQRKKQAGGGKDPAIPPLHYQILSRDRCSDKGEGDRREIQDPIHAALIANSLSWLEYRLDVAQELLQELPGSATLERSGV